MRFPVSRSERLKERQQDSRRGIAVSSTRAPQPAILGAGDRAEPDIARPTQAPEGMTRRYHRRQTKHGIEQGIDFHDGEKPVDVLAARRMEIRVEELVRLPELMFPKYTGCSQPIGETIY